jgi:hypothetical protein
MVYCRFAAESDRHLSYDVQPLRGKFGGARFLVAAAPISEEILEKLAAFVLADTGGNQATVIQLRHLQKIDHAAGGASFRVETAKNHPTQPDMYDCAGTHGARLFSNVQITIVKPPIADGALGLGDSQHFGVSGGILERFDLVPGSADDGTFGYDDRHDRHFFCRPCLSGLAQGFAHEISVARKIQHFGDA